MTELLIQLYTAVKILRRCQIDYMTGRSIYCVTQRRKLEKTVDDILDSIKMELK